MAFLSLLRYTASPPITSAQRGPNFEHERLEALLEGSGGTEASWRSTRPIFLQQSRLSFRASYIAGDVPPYANSP